MVCVCGGGVGYDFFFLVFFFGEGLKGGLVTARVYTVFAREAGIWLRPVIYDLPDLSSHAFVLAA